MKKFYKTRRDKYATSPQEKEKTGINFWELPEIKSVFKVSLFCFRLFFALCGRMWIL
jgi:hypothetical protein